MKRRDWSVPLLWVIYLALLGVLLPHTAWAFGQFEPVGAGYLGWVAAVAFEGAIAAFTFRLKERIEDTPRYTAGTVAWRKFRHRYVNVYSLGMVVAITISAMANWAHSVEYGSEFAVFTRYAVPPLLYTVAFGAVLPMCSLLFARILADVQEGEAEVNAETQALKVTVADLRRQVRESEHRLVRAEDAARLVLELTAEDKARRIRAAAEQWPALSQAMVAELTHSSPSYVSQVLRGNGGSG